MTAIDPTTLTPDQLATMLREWANGLFPGEAAVELLIAHGRWLARKDFLGQLVDAVDDGWASGGRTVPMAAIDWARVEDFLNHPHTGGSSSEIAILRIAASLAGAETVTSLMGLTRSLDQTNTGLVLEAIAHRAGWHERGHTQTISGHVRETRRAAAGRAIPRRPTQAPA